MSGWWTDSPIPLFYRLWGTYLPGQVFWDLLPPWNLEWLLCQQVPAIMMQHNWWVHECLGQGVLPWGDGCAKETKPIGNESHTIADDDNGVALTWWYNLSEGKDRPQPLGPKKWDETGKTVGLMLHMTEPIHVVTMASGFCVLKGFGGIIAWTGIDKNVWNKLAKVHAREWNWWLL